MDRGRIEGGLKTLSGRVKDFFGHMLGDTKLRTEGKMDQAKGKAQNVMGGIKDALKK